MARSKQTKSLRLISLTLFACLILAATGDTVSGEAEAPLFPLPLSAPWQADLTLHAAGDGYGYGPGPTHRNTDLYALDFNGWPDENNPPVETNDDGLLVFSMADGCVKQVEENKGYYVEKDGKKEWVGNYGWNVTITHAWGYEVRYAHLQAKPLVSKDEGVECGPKITQGQAIGKIGGTGTENNSAVHLHLAMYYCDPSNEKCSIQPVKPEPMEGIEQLDDPKKTNDRKKVTSRNYGVGYEVFKSGVIKDLNEIKVHKPIVNEYRAMGGQYSFFGRTRDWVKPYQDTTNFFQQFEPFGLMSTFPTTILEAGNQAFTIPGPIWTVYNQQPEKYGIPYARFYLTQQKKNESGWRVDFTNASMFWNFTLDSPIIWDESTTPWKASFCPKANQFSCMPVRRFDPYIDFEFSDSNNTGPLTVSQGFSTIWEAHLDGKLLSKYSLGYELQGHARFYINGQAQGEWINAEDAPISGVTQPTWHMDDNDFVIRLWQAPGKPARLKVEIKEDVIIPLATGFDSDGTLASGVYVPPPVEYADFEPPPYPGEAGTTPEEPPIPPDLVGWWNALVERIRQAIQGWLEELGDLLTKELEDWWQENQERLLAELQKAITEALLKLVQALEQQCCGSYALVGFGIALAWGFSRRRRR